ncbi:MAG: glycosyltransferase family 39 protein [Elusimicrobia bacterium]|nr:glycosyltransferase family 39 protein [Elusimicrobiota bacterium]
MFAVTGYTTWLTGKLETDPNNPPLAKLWSGWPLLLLRPKVDFDAPEWRGGFSYPFAERVLYYSGNDGDALLAASRLANVLLSCVFAGGLFWAARRRWGDVPALVALAAYAFSPNVLAHAARATNDLPAAAAITAAAICTGAFLEEGRRELAKLAVLLGRVAFLCKYSAVLILPLWCAAALGLAARRDQRAPQLALLVVAPYAAGVALLLLVLPAAAGGILSRLREVGGSAPPAFLFGLVRQGGFWLYGPAAALVKSTLPELALAGAAAWLLHRSRRLDAWLPALLGLAYLAELSLSAKQIGLRYALPLYPCLAWLAAPVAAELFKRGKSAAVLLAATLHASSALAQAPQFLPYFNEAAGGRMNGWRLLADSNVDWGQDLKRLGAFLRKDGEPEVILSYFGTASNEFYGIRAQHYASQQTVQRRRRNSDKPARELLVVSATHLQGVYPPAHRNPTWLARRLPIARVGASLFVYDVTVDAEAHALLADGYRAAGDPALAAREDLRAR